MMEGAPPRWFLSAFVHIRPNHRVTMLRPPSQQHFADGRPPATWAVGFSAPYRYIRRAGVRDAGH